MFGHHDDNNLPEPDGNLVHGDQGQDATAPPVVEDTAGAYIDDVTPVGGSSAAPAVTDDQSDNGLAADTTASDPDPVAAPAGPAPAVTDAAVSAAPAPGATADTDKLLDIKQQALQQLTPLVGHLEQSPEEKFRTTMMMIQASDNHELVPAAYEAAGQITDEKVRAQALLDIVNEINYFTHSNNDAAA